MTENDSRLKVLLVCNNAFLKGNGLCTAVQALRRRLLSAGVDARLMAVANDDPEGEQPDFPLGHFVFPVFEPLIYANGFRYAKADKKKIRAAEGDALFAPFRRDTAAVCRQGTLDPLEDCRIKGSLSDWDGLPRSKSLFHAREGCGLPIGNLTSQMFSNVYLNELDQYMKRELHCRHYGRYVDDFYVVSADREWLHSLIPSVRSYVSSFSLYRMDGKISLLESSLSSPDAVHLRSLLSSMMGLMRQHNSYHLRFHLVQTRLRPFLEYGRFDAELTKFIPDAE